MATDVTVLDRQDIQGILLSSYKHLPFTSYLMCRVGDPAAARTWLAGIADEITNATGKRDDCSANLALTHRGLRALRLNPRTLDSFPAPFTDGMDSPTRASILGDQGDSAPEKWRWGNEAVGVDLMLMVFAPDEPTLEAFVSNHTAQMTGPGGMTLVADLRGCRLPGDQEHFGFHDGVGQPIIEGNERRARKQEYRTGHVTVVKAGEFVLGYHNEYGQMPVGPVVIPAEDPDDILPDYTVPEDVRFEEQQGSFHDLGRNGSFLAFRQLEQDVPGFWRFLDEATRDSHGSSDPVARERLGAKIVGRWPSGAPLVLCPEADDPAYGDANDFSYAQTDPQGFACPVGSHIRRANPRDAMRSDVKDSLASVRRHRIMRMGRFYGPPLREPWQPDGVERGIHFIALNADLERQFEFVQQTWLNNSVFGDLQSEVDPLVGDQDSELSERRMTVPADPVRERVSGLPRFVHVRGGAYFFVPGMNALRWMARAPINPPPQ